MRDKRRIKPFLAEFEKLWDKNPDMRFGQLIENFLFRSTYCNKGAHVYLFHQEDDISFSELKKLNK